MFDANNNNGFMNGYGMQQPTMNGFNYGGFQQQPVQKFNNPLTEEQIKRLQQKGSEFSLGITEEEWLRGICNHRSADGTSDMLTYDPATGIAKCTICGYQFRPIDSKTESIDTIEGDVERIIDILQTIKLMYVDLPGEAAKEYFQIIPLLNKIPKLFEFAAKNMAKHETNIWQYNGRNMGAVNMFNNLSSLFGMGMNPMNPGMAPNMGMNPAMGQPMPGMMPQQPMMGNPAFQQPMSNGFGYPGASMAPGMAPAPGFNNGYAPAAPGFAYAPQQAATAPAPATVTAPTATPAEQPKAEATVTQNVSV